MQISLTKKLADALNLKSSPAKHDVDPLFSWTANWTKVWANRRVEDMIVLVNNATQFTKQWAGYWNLELDSYKSKPKLIHLR